MSVQWPDVTCPNGHKTTPEITVDQAKQSCTTCGKNYGVNAFGEVVDTDALRALFKTLGFDDVT